MSEEDQFEHSGAWVFDKRRRSLDRCESAALELLQAIRVERHHGSPEGSMDDRPMELARQLLRLVHDAYDDVAIREQQDYLYKKERWERNQGA